MTKKIPANLRRIVSERAGYCCEYCHLQEEYFFDTFQIDHILSIKHGGKSELKNLAYSCPECNRYKGSDLGTFISGIDQLTRIFNPQIDIWDNHFEVSEGEFYPKTDIGKSTIIVLRLKDADRIIIRQEIMKD